MLLIIIIIVIILLLFFSVHYCTSSNSKKNFKEQTIKTLVRQASRWSTAADQDENPMIAVLHANYGAGYLWALKDIANDEDISEVTGIDVLKFRDGIIAAQDKATQKMVKMCPDFAPKRTYLTELGGE